MATLLEFQTAINNANTKVAATVKGKAAEAFLADDAIQLGGWTKTQYVQNATSALTAHANDKNNPHGVTAATIGAYSKSEIDQLIQKRIPGGFLPLSRFGESGGGGGDDSPPSAGAMNNPKRIWINETKILMNGSGFTMPYTTITPPTTGSSNIYLRLVAGAPEYFVTPLQVADSPTYMLIGTCYADTGTTLPTISLMAVTRLGSYRPNINAHGMSIAVSSGFAGGPGTLRWT